MHTQFVERHIRSLSIAKTCAELGARIRTITLHHRARARRARPPFLRRQALRSPGSPSRFSGVVSPEGQFDREGRSGHGRGRLLPDARSRIRSNGCACRRVQALPRAMQANPRINFDRAFDLVCHTQGIWIADRPQLALATCPRCQSQHLTGLGERPSHHRPCPFCQLVKRYWCDKRVQATFPPRSLPAVKSSQFGLLSAFLSVDC